MSSKAEPVSSLSPVSADETKGEAEIHVSRVPSNKPDAAPPSTFAPSSPFGLSGEEPVYDFADLKYIEKPDSPLNRDTLPQTLQDCVGYLQALPLVQPNVDAENPTTIVDMTNILTIPQAEAKLQESMGLTEESAFTLDPQEYCERQRQAYDYSSEVMQKYLRKAKRATVHSHAALPVIGRTVQSGNISVYKRYGTYYAVPEGRWKLFPSQLARWCAPGNLSLDQDLIRVGGGDGLLIVRINEGQCGLITDRGLHKLLAVGTHVFNTGTVKFLGRVNYAEQKHFLHGPYHYINVPRGQYAKVWAEVVGEDGVKSLVPRLLKEGEHFIKSSFFQYIGLVNVSAEYIGHGSVHILNVLKGHVAKIFHDNMPRLLGEGRHIIESPNFAHKGVVEIVASPCIVHGTITVIQVPEGQIALVWNNNEPFFIDRPGIYEFNSDEFTFVQFVEASERNIELGSKKIIQVYTGEVGITYDQGELKILTSGRHVIDSSTHVFERFLSTKQRSIRLISYNHSAQLTKSYKNDTTKAASYASQDADLLVCETKDLVKVGVRADVFYSISDPEKCIRNLDTDELEDLVRETAVATLTNIIRSTALNQIAQSKNVSAGAGAELLLAGTAIQEGEEEEEDGAAVQTAVSLFFDRAHDEFMSKLHDDFVCRYGVDIANIRMEAFKIMDTELADQISRHVLTTAQTENELANLEGLNQIATQKQRTQAEVAEIEAQAEAKASKTRADAQNKRRIDAATTEAEALQIKAMAEARAEAEVILAKAKAEAEAIKLKAMAEAERAQQLSATELGQRESLLGIYADMVKQSNNGVAKVIYMDPSVNRDSPFALGSLDELNRDLHSLSKIGIASSDAADSSKQKR